MGEPERIFERFHKEDPRRERVRAKQVELVRGYKHLALKVHESGEDTCSCVEWVAEMADMIEALHKRIDVLDPDSEVYSQHLQELVALEESKRKLLQDEQAL